VSTVLFVIVTGSPVCAAMKVNEAATVVCPASSSLLRAVRGKTAASSASSAPSKRNSIASKSTVAKRSAVRAHQHLGGATPAETWRGVAPYATMPKSVQRFEAWDGLLVGYYLRH
jgi:hypothetical protein